MAADSSTQINGGQYGKDEGLQSGDQHTLEQVDRDTEGQGEPSHGRNAQQHGHVAGHEIDQEVPRQQVGPQSDGQREQPQEVRDDLQGVQEDQHASADARRDQARDISLEPLGAEALDVVRNEYAEGQYQW